jgi:hypothetical protein
MIPWKNIFKKVNLDNNFASKLWNRKMGFTALGPKWPKSKIKIFLTREPHTIKLHRSELIQTFAIATLFIWAQETQD